jgi:hypothetical protein
MKLPRMKLPISKGAHVAFEGSPWIWIVEDPEMFQCEKPCPIPHESECFDEPYVRVKREIFTTMPVSQLRTLFDGTGMGHSFVGGHHWDCKCEECL